MRRLVQSVMYSGWTIQQSSMTYSGCLYNLCLQYNALQRVADWGGVVRSVLVWFGAGRTSLVWCSTVVDVLIVGRGITDAHLRPIDPFP
jgi:hypothetical protein